MWSEPSTRKKPPATKYLAVLRSWAPSSSSGYGVVRTGDGFPGTNLNIAAITTEKKATYVRNCSEERCLRYTPAGRLAEPRLQEVDRERPTQVEDHQRRQDHPGADERAARMADILAGVAGTQQRPRRPQPAETSLLLARHPNTFSISTT